MMSQSYAPPSHGTERPPLVLAAAADDAFAIGLGITLFSALKNYRGGRAVQVYVMDGGISPANRERIERVSSGFDVGLHWLDPPNERLRGLRPISRVTMPTYYRLLIPDLLPAAYTRLIFLDSDLVILGDLEELWEREMGGSVILAAQDHDNSVLADVFLNCEELSLPPDAPYFNSGVLVMDLERWREERLGDRVVDYARENLEHLTFAEQDAMNAVLRERWGKLELTWNLFPMDMDQFSEGTAEKVLREVSAGAMIPYLRSLRDPPHILHFVGKQKPWTGRLNHPTRHVFFLYWRESGWFTRREWLVSLPIYWRERTKAVLLELRRVVRRWWRRRGKAAGAA